MLVGAKNPVATALGTDYCHNVSIRKDPRKIVAERYDAEVSTIS